MYVRNYGPNLTDFKKVPHYHLHGRTHMLANTQRIEVMRVYEGEQHVLYMWPRSHPGLACRRAHPASEHQASKQRHPYGFFGRFGAG